MALRYFSKSAALSRTPQAAAKAGQDADLQVDYSYTQWRYAQMLQLERNYLAGCDAVDSAAAA